MRKSLILVILNIMVLACVDISKAATCSEQDPNACIEAANDLFRKNKPIEAKKMLEEACSWKSARACLKAGIVAERESRFDEAEKYYKKACELNKDDKCANIEKLTASKKAKGAK